MNFKPKKSCSLSVRKGKMDAAMTFIVANKQIQIEEPIKSLGRWYHSSMTMKDTKRGEGAAELATKGLLAANRCMFRVNS